MLHLDDLDFRIIKELGGSSSPQWNVRESYSNISKKLGVDEETVRLRVKKAKESGFLPAWRVMVNPSLINCAEANLDLEVSEGKIKADVISKIKSVDGVYAIVDFVGKEISVMMYHEADEALANRVQQIEFICGSTKLAIWNKRFPRPDIKMKFLDWKIIDAMREDAWRDVDDMAESLDVSARTVQRRLSAMKEGRAIYLSRPPNVNVVGGLMCHFLVFCSDPGKKRAVDYAVHSAISRIGSSETSPENFSLFGISCENYSEADNVTERMRTIDGVTDVKMRVVKDIIVVQDWLRDQIAHRL